jgi:hypothetical protein
VSTHRFAPTGYGSNKWKSVFAGKLFDKAVAKVCKPGVVSLLPNVIETSPLNLGYIKLKVHRVLLRIPVQHFLAEDRPSSIGFLNLGAPYRIGTLFTQKQGPSVGAAHLCCDHVYGGRMAILRAMEFEDRFRYYLWALTRGN